LISPGLVTVDEAGQPMPDLARDYQLLDAQTLEFNLRQGLTFHDGTPLTSEDVKATFDGMISRAMPSPRSDKLEAVERIEVLGPLTLRIHLKRPYAPILAELSLGILPRARAVPPAALEQDRAPIGAGPFRFAGQPDEEHLMLLPFDGYYGGKPRISRLLIRTVRDQTTRVLELLKGRADLVVGAVSPSVFPSLEKNPRLQIRSRPGTAYAYLALNSRSGPLADVRIRRAICHAIDIQPIVEAKFHGFAEPATGMLPRSHWAYASTPGCRKDLALSTRLLEEAGYSSVPTYPEESGRDAPTSIADGRKPRLHLTLKVSTDRFRRSVALIFQDQLAQVGIQLEIRAFELGTFFNDVRKGNFELASLVWSSVIEPDLLRWAFASANIPSPENSFGGQNRTGYHNVRLDALLDRATMLEPEARKAVYAEALALIDADLPYIPLWHESSLAIVSSHLADFEPSPQGFLQPLAKAREARP